MENLYKSMAGCNEITYGQVNSHLRREYKSTSSQAPRLHAVTSSRIERL